jgi:hypothetical protein
VKLLVDTPNCPDAERPTCCYSGKVIVFLKDATLDPSTPWRHAAETLEAVRHHGLHTQARALFYGMPHLVQCFQCKMQYDVQTNESTKRLFIKMLSRCDQDVCMSVQVLAIKTDGGPDRNVTLVNVSWHTLRLLKSSALICLSQCEQRQGHRT